MTNTDTRKYETLRRIQTFGQTYRDRFPAGSLGAEAFAIIDSVLARLDGLAGGTTMPAPDRRLALGTSRQAVLAQLEAIRRSARAIARVVPGFDESFHIPVPRHDRRVLATARLVVDAATTQQAQFLAWGMPADFVTSLGQAADALEAALQRRQGESDGVVADRADTATALREGFEAKGRLHVLIGNQLAGDPAALAVWASDRRVERFRRARPQAAATSPSTVTATSGGREDVALMEVPKAA